MSINNDIDRLTEVAEQEARLSMQMPPLHDEGKDIHPEESQGTDSDGSDGSVLSADAIDEIDERPAIQQDLQLRYDSLTNADSDEGDTDMAAWIVSAGMRNWRFVLFIVACLLGAAYWPQQFALKQRRVDKLELELEDLRNRTLFTTAELVALERVSSIEESVGLLDLDLEPSTVPPFEIVVPVSKPKD